MASLEEEPLLFSISLFPPSSSTPTSSGENPVNGEDDQLTLEQRHRCACHFVSRLHHYFGSARFVAHVHADIPERLLREVYEASGYRTRFISYEIVSKISDAPVQPGATPAPTGRPPAVAAAAAAAAQAAVKEAAAAAEGAGADGTDALASAGDIQAYGLLAPAVEVAQPKVRGNIVAGSLIGATFARSFGADGTWEGTVVKFVDSRNKSGSGKAGGSSTGKKVGVGKDAYGSGVEIVDGYVKDPNGKYRRGPGGWSFVVEQSSLAAAAANAQKSTSINPPGSKSARSGVKKSASEGAATPGANDRNKRADGSTVAKAGQGARGGGGGGNSKKRPIAAVSGSNSEASSGSRRHCAHGPSGGGTASTSPPTGGNFRNLRGVYRCPEDKTMIYRMAFWGDIWPALAKAGWRLETIITPNRNDKYYFPPGIYRGNGNMVRRDFFDSARQMVEKVKSMKEWAPLLKDIIDRAKAGTVFRKYRATAEAEEQATSPPPFFGKKRKSTSTRNRLPVSRLRAPGGPLAKTLAPTPAPVAAPARSKSRAPPATTPKTNGRSGRASSAPPAAAAAPTASKTRSPAPVSPLLSTPTPRKPPRVRQTVSNAAPQSAPEKNVATAPASTGGRNRCRNRVGGGATQDEMGSNDEASTGASKSRSNVQKQSAADSTGKTAEAKVKLSLPFAKSEGVRGRTRTRGGPSGDKVAADAVVSGSPPYPPTEKARAGSRVGSEARSGKDPSDSSGAVVAADTVKAESQAKVQEIPESSTEHESGKQARGGSGSGGGGAGKRRNIVPEDVISWGKMGSSRPPPRQRRPLPSVRVASPPAVGGTAVSSSSSSKAKNRRTKSIVNEEGVGKDGVATQVGGVDGPSEEHKQAAEDGMHEGEEIQARREKEPELENQDKSDEGLIDYSTGGREAEERAENAEEEAAAGHTGTKEVPADHEASSMVSAVAMVTEGDQDELSEDPEVATMMENEGDDADSEAEGARETSEDQGGKEERRLSGGSDMDTDGDEQRLLGAGGNDGDAEGAAADDEVMDDAHDDDEAMDSGGDNKREEMPGATAMDDVNMMGGTNGNDVDGVGDSVLSAQQDERRNGNDDFDDDDDKAKGTNGETLAVQGSRKTHGELGFAVAGDATEQGGDAYVDHVEANTKYNGEAAVDENPSASSLGAVRSTSAQATEHEKPEDAEGGDNQFAAAKTEVAASESGEISSRPATVTTAAAAVVANNETVPASSLPSTAAAANVTDANRSDVGQAAGYRTVQKLTRQSSAETFQTQRSTTASKATTAARGVTTPTVAAGDAATSAAGAGAENPSASAVEKRGANAETMTPCRTSGRRRIASNRAKDAEEDELRKKKNHGGAGTVVDGEGGGFAFSFGGGAGATAAAGGVLSFPSTVDTSVLARPTDLFVCRYKDGYEEKLTLWRLRQLGAAFRYPRPPLTPSGAQPRQAQIQAQGKKEDAGSAVRAGLIASGEPAAGGSRKDRCAQKPGAARVVGAMRLSTLWAHRGKETVVAVSIYDNPGLLAAEIISLLSLMNEQGRDVGVTYWESPERKCLNECRLPLPELPEVQSTDGVGDGAAQIQRGKDTSGRELGPGWVESPGGWKEPRHCHTGSLIIWKAGAARYRAKAAGDFQEHCCAALMGSRNVPPGVETMLFDGFLSGTGVLQNSAVFRLYARRSWFHKLTNGASDSDGSSDKIVPALPMNNSVAPPGARFLVKKVGLQIGKVPRRREAIYVCSPPAAMSSGPSSRALSSAMEAEQSMPTIAPDGVKQEDTAAGAPWWTLRGNVPHSNGVPMKIEGGLKESYRPHFLTCIVCQRGGSPGDVANADGSIGDVGKAPAGAEATPSAFEESPGTSNVVRPPVPSTNTEYGNDIIDSNNGPRNDPGVPRPLLLCTTCPASFHLPCLRPRLRTMPEGEWSCAYCYATGRARGGDSDGACGAVRLMESLRQGMQGAVRVNTVRTLRYNAIG